ncbi:MAG: hypothetical protein HYV16_05985 [Gammaproteobacteria bacterium]|nr:hypothetical protein [Gammaproteobacteria bacterium]
MKLPIKSLFALTLSLSLSGTALAHTDEILDQQKTPHGGQLRMAGPYHIELVLKADGLDAYLTDHAGTAKPAAGTSAAATVVNGKAVQRLVLKPAEGNRLHAAASLDAAAPSQIVLKLDLPDGTSQSARFDLNKPKQAHHDHEHGHGH